MLTLNARKMTSTLLAAALFAGAVTLQAPSAVAASGLEQYIGDPPASFARPDEAVAILKTTLLARDYVGLAKVLGLDAEKLKTVEGIAERVDEIGNGASKLIVIKDAGDQKKLIIGPLLWPFPFPLAQNSDGRWAFDARAGLEEIRNRRIGENELQAIATMHAYVEAQQDYAGSDHDEDGVLEYAQKLVSSPGTTDGLYWPLEQGDGESPAGPYINASTLSAVEQGGGYFGYNFRVLRGQGRNVAGGRFDYVINGNMIAGYGLVAWPSEYGETGVKSFVVNQAGIVYEKDLGWSTAAEVKLIRRFNPDKSWSISAD